MSRPTEGRNTFPPQTGFRTKDATHAGSFPSRTAKEGMGGEAGDLLWDGRARAPVPGKGRSSYDVILTCNYSPWSRYKGGGQKSVDMLARAFAKHGARVCVVCSRAPWERVQVPEGLPYDLEWAFFFGIRPGISSPLRFLNGISFLRKVGRLSGSRTLIVGNGDEASLLAWVAAKGRFLFASRNTYEDGLKGLDWTRKTAWLRIFFMEPRHAAVALAMQTADLVTCTSGFSRDQIQECFGIPAHRIAIIPNGIDPAFLGGGFRKKGQRGILFFGRLAANKGPHLVLESFARLPPQVRASHPLIMIGNGPLLGPLKRSAIQKGIQQDVSFREWLGSAKLAREIASCKVAFLPSLEESFGNAILETLALGQKLVSTRVCAIPEIADGYASLVPLGDVEEMARLLLHELDRERSGPEIVSQRIHFRERYSWEASARQYLALGRVRV